MKFEEKYWDDALVVLKQQERKAFWLLWGKRAIFLIPLVVALSTLGFYFLNSSSTQAFRADLKENSKHLEAGFENHQNKSNGNIDFIVAAEENSGMELPPNIERNSLVSDQNIEHRKSSSSESTREVVSKQDLTSVSENVVTNGNVPKEAEGLVEKPDNADQTLISASELTARASTPQLSSDIDINQDEISDANGNQNDEKDKGRADIEEENNKIQTINSEQIRGQIRLNLNGIETSEGHAEELNLERPIHAEDGNSDFMSFANLKPLPSYNTSHGLALVKIKQPKDIFPVKIDHLFVQLSNSLKQGYGAAANRDKLNLGLALGYDKAINSKWSASAAIGGYTIGGLQNQIEIRNYELGFGRTYTSTFITASEMLLVHVPISLHYSFKKRLELTVGAEADFIVNVKSDVDQTATGYNGTTNNGSNTEWGYTAGFNRFLPDAFVGVGYRITPKMTIFGNYHLGLSTVGKSDIYKIGKNDRNNRIELGLKYRLRP